MDISIININDLLINNNIQLSKSFSVNKDQKKISIGYNDTMDLYIESPIAISISNNYIRSYNLKLKLRFEPLLGQMLKFYNVLIQIESLIKQHVQSRNIDFKLCSIFKNDQIDLFDQSPDDYIKYI